MRLKPPQFSLLQLLRSIPFPRHDIRELFSWFAGLLCVAWATRYYAMLESYQISDIWPRDWIVVRAMASDVASAGLVVLLYYLARLRVVMIALALAWCFFSAGNITNIVVNDTNLSIFSLAEGMQKDFILGSVLTREVIAAFAACLLLMACGYMAASYCYRTVQNHSARPLHYLHYAIFSLLMGCSVYISNPNTNTGWSNSHMVENNLRDAIDGNLSISKLRPDLMRQYVYTDLHGTPMIAYPKDNKPNVLLIIVEGLSANMLDAGWTPRLAEWRQHGIYYKNFIANGDRTINGVYSITCGDYPRLYKRTQNLGADSVSKLPGLPKKLDCLPRLLGRNGYETTFLQGANLEFDNKLRFNWIAGYKKQHGKVFFRNARGFNGEWGPNDSAFFNGVYDLIKRLEGGKSRWMLGTLTVGTHHPFIIPRKYRMPKDRRHAAFIFMDIHLDKLLRRLQQDGILDHTLVLITGDEASWHKLAPLHNIHNKLTIGRGFMMALTPNKDVMEVSEPFMQADTMLSVADYLGLPTGNIAMGRSIFRHYGTFRPVFFGSSLKNNIVGMLKPEEIIACPVKKTSLCQRYHTASSEFFAQDLSAMPLPATDAGYFLQVAATISDRIYTYPPPSRKKHPQKGRQQNNLKKGAAADIPG